jgi:polyisoprenoid-binding protein YceI
VRYRIDSSASRITIRAFAGGVLGGMGHNPTFLARDLAGEVEFDPGPPSASSVRLAVKSSSLGLLDSISDKDRREIERVTNQEVLESEAYPEVLFVAERVALTGSPGGPLQATLDGELTLHGVSRPCQVPLRIYPSGDMVRAQGETTLRQSEYRINLVAVAGGMLKVKDEVKLAFDIVARPVAERQPATGQTADRQEGAGGVGVPTGSTGIEAAS